MYGPDMDNLFIAMIVFFMVIGATIAGVCFWLVPWLWSMIKPWLHMVTT